MKSAMRWGRARCGAILAMTFVQGCMLEVRERVQLSALPANGVSVGRSAYYDGHHGIRVVTSTMTPGASATSPAFSGRAAAGDGAIGGRVDVYYASERNGPLFIGPVIPFIPVRLRWKPKSPAGLDVSVRVEAWGDTIHLSAERMRLVLPGGGALAPSCRGLRAGSSQYSPCDSVIAPGAVYSVTLHFDLDPLARPLPSLALGSLTQGGRTLELPVVSARRRRELYYGFPPA